jgi:hypothetical protein
VKNQFRFTAPPPSLRKTKLDNLALVSADLLPHKQEWQALANRLPPRAILIVLPKMNAVQKQTMLAVAKLLSREGHQVRVIPADEVARDK